MILIYINWANFNQCIGNFLLSRALYYVSPSIQSLSYTERNKWITKSILQQNRIGTLNFEHSTRRIHLKTIFSTHIWYLIYNNLLRRTKCLNLGYQWYKAPMIFFGKNQFRYAYSYTSPYTAQKNSINIFIQKCGIMTTFKNWKKRDWSDNLSFYCEPNRVQFGSWSKEKLSLLSKYGANG